MRTMFVVISVCFLAFAWCMSGCAGSQQSPADESGSKPILDPGGGFGKIAGVVTDEAGEPVVGVTVSLDNTSMGAVTNSDGRYTILNVPAGRYALRFSAEGFQALNIVDVAVTRDLTTYENHMLETQP